MEDLVWSFESSHNIYLPACFLYQTKCINNQAMSLWSLGQWGKQSAQSHDSLEHVVNPQDL